MTTKSFVTHRMEITNAVFPHQLPGAVRVSHVLPVLGTYLAGVILVDLLATRMLKDIVLIHNGDASALAPILT